MTLTVGTRYTLTSDRVPSTALDLNAISAICECGTYLFSNVDSGQLEHTLACWECHNPRTGEGDPEACDRPHLCGRVTPAICLHGRCGAVAAPHETEGICIDDLNRCCGCCQPPDYEADYDLN